MRYRITSLVSYECIPYHLINSLWTKLTFAGCRQSELSAGEGFLAQYKKWSILIMKPCRGIMHSTIGNTKGTAFTLGRKNIVIWIYNLRYVKL